MGKTAKFAYGGSAAQAVGAGNSILFPTAVSKTRAIQGNGSGEILLRAPGTYRVVSSFTLNATAAGTVNVQMSKGGVPAASAKAGATLAAAGDLATVSIVDYVTVVSGIGGSYATLTFAPDAAVGIEAATVLVERVCG